MNSNGPVTDYQQTLPPLKSSVLIAKGIGKESKVVLRRPGTSVKTVLTSGQLPFKVNKVWTAKNLILLDLLEANLTVVYKVDP